jgi:hypothetical protein
MQRLLQPHTIAKCLVATALDGRQAYIDSLCDTHLWTGMQR